jgi:lipoyl(octanoyl) transferase
MNRYRRPPEEMLVCHLGRIPYRDALAMQHDLAARRRAGELPDTLLLLEHPPVYTRGRRSLPGELTLGEEFYRARGIEVVSTDRGGRVTYHGPGQLVGYPIMGVTDVIAHLRTIEDAIVAALAEEGIAARSRPQDGPDYTGVWVEERKLASLGVHVSRGVATHGFAVNVATDLEPFGWIVACGLPGVQMTSIAAELGGDVVAPERFSARMAASFCRAHGRRPRSVSPRQLGLAGPSKPLAPPAGRTPAARRLVEGLARADDPPLAPAPSPAPPRVPRVVGV